MDMSKAEPTVGRTFCVEISIFILNIMKRFKNIKDILERIAKKTGLDEKLKEAKILEVWNKEVGEKISNHTLPEKLVKGKLFVKVDSNVWMNQLTFLKKDIITKLNKAIGENLIKDIYFKL